LSRIHCGFSDEVYRLANKIAVCRWDWVKINDETQLENIGVTELTGSRMTEVREAGEIFKK
jgi:hypothetical protein